MFAIAQPEPGSKTRLKVYVERKHVDRAYQKLYQDLANRGDIRGFRKGKVPAWRIRRQYGDTVVDGAIYGELVEQALRCCLTYGDLQPTQPADFGDDDEERGGVEGKPLEIETVLHVRPETRIPDYKGIELKQPDSEPTEEQIDAEVKALQEAAVELIEVDRVEVHKGDLVDVALTMKVVGEDDEPEERDESLVVGEDRYDPALDEPLLNRKVGETVESTVDYPDQPAMGDLAGEKVEMKAEIKGLRERRIPELTDEFAAQAIDGCSSVDELREELTRRAREQNEALAREILRGQAIKWLGDNVRIDLPESLAQTAEQRAAELESDESDAEDAMRLVRTAIACGALLEQEGVEVTEEELRQAYMRMGAMQGLDPSLLMEDDLIPEVAGALRDRAARQKAGDLIADAATCTVVPLSELQEKDDESEESEEEESSEGTEEPTEDHEDE